MCGIAGFYDMGKRLEEKELRRATDVIGHRGPDDSGYHVFNFADANIGFGHRRLSILDLSPLGHQPMFDATGQYAILLNGEIYNFLEVRKPLEKLGYSFRSNSDTEVVLYALMHYGMKAIDRFIGMFSIAFLDIKEQQLYLIRDRAGVKPLYYYHHANILLFSSELKSFHEYSLFKKEINPAAVKLFFQYGYIPAPHTIFQNTHKLLPGHYLAVDCKSGRTDLHKYWDVYEYYNKPKLDISEEDAVEEAERLLHSAFNYRMVSDVPVGLFFSGGYDSATLAAILQADATEKIKTFTIGFHEPEYNEAPHAKKIAEYIGTDHHEYYCSHEEAAAIIPELPFFFDEPFGDSSAIPTILVSQFARKQVTVALSADAGDEIFGGYNRYGYLTKIQRNLKYLPSFLSRISSGALNSINVSRLPYLKNKTGMLHRYKMLADVIHTKDVFAHNTILSSRYTQKEIRAMLKNTNMKVASTFFDSMPFIEDSNDDLSKILAVDFKTYLPDDILVKVDRATMSVALEGREPFVDHRIIEWAAQLPIDLKIKGGDKKYLLKKLAHRYIPAQMLNKPKMGFGVPITVWFQSELKDLFDEYLSKEAIRKSEYLDAPYIEILKKKYLENPTENEANNIWLLLMFQMWWKRWMG